MSYLFSTVGQIFIDKTKMGEDEMMMTALDAGASDVSDDGEQWLITTDYADLWTVREKLEGLGLVVADSKIAKVSSTTIELSGKDAEQAMRIVDALDDLDDVQNVWSNFDIDDETAAQLS